MIVRVPVHFKMSMFNFGKKSSKFTFDTEAHEERDVGRNLFLYVEIFFMFSRLSMFTVYFNNCYRDAKGLFNMNTSEFGS